MENFKIAVSLLVFLLFSIQGVVFADEIYQDENGVWTNRPRLGVSSKSEASRSGGLNSVSHGEASSEAINSSGNKSARNLGASAYKAAKDSGVTKAYTEFWQGAGDAYIAEWKCKHQGICPRIMEGAKLEEYEKFDDVKAREFKSEWEFFEDPRQ